MESHPTYEILQEIGRGETATVYRARDLGLKRYVAIKELRVELRRDARRMEQFREEAQFLAGIEHDNIVQVHGLDKDRGWIIMELMRGGLDAKLAEGPLSPELVRSILRQALGALECLHQKGRLHGAVKPSNLLINDQGRVKLSDASGVPIGGEMRRPSGVPKYLAPELLNPEFGTVGPASDLYSLGFTALELLMGPKFEGLFQGVAAGSIDPQLAWMRWQSSKTERLSSVRELVRGVPADLAAVVDRLVKKEVAERYATAAEAIKDLENKPILLVEPPRETAPPPLPPAASAPTGPAVRPVGDPAPVSYQAPVPPRATAPPSASAPARPQATKARASSAKPWSREWLNEKLSQPSVFYPVIAAIVIPTIGLAALMLSNGGGTPQRPQHPAAKKPHPSKPAVTVERTPKPSPVAATNIPSAGPRSVRVESDPQGALASITDLGPDGSRRTPAIFELAKGRHHLRLELQGHDPVEQDVDVQPGSDEMLVSVTLRKMAATEPRPQPKPDSAPEPRITNSVGMTLVLVPPGKFLMGSPEGEGEKNEHPQHPVEISAPFYMGTTEVTQEQYQKVLGENPSRFRKKEPDGKGPSDLPVEQVSQEDARRFCAKLAEIENLPKDSYRLPTEAEWEYAARGGPGASRNASDAAGLDDFGWYLGNSERRTHPVGGKKPNGLGLYDMAGNVSEWCADWYGEDYYAHSEPVDPTGPKEPGSKPIKVRRGGSWLDPAPLCRPTDRNGAPPNQAENVYGFRIVRSAVTAGKADGDSTPSKSGTQE